MTELSRTSGTGKLTSTSPSCRPGFNFPVLQARESSCPDGGVEARRPPATEAAIAEKPKGNKGGGAEWAGRNGHPVQEKRELVRLDDGNDPAHVPDFVARNGDDSSPFEHGGFVARELLDGYLAKASG